MRAATAAAEPPLEPPARRASRQGLPTWSVVAPAPNSCVWVWPISTTPASRRRAQTVLFVEATLPASTRLDAVSGRPWTP